MLQPHPLLQNNSKYSFENHNCRVYYIKFWSCNKRVVSLKLPKHHFKQPQNLQWLHDMNNILCLHIVTAALKPTNLLVQAKDLTLHLIYFPLSIQKSLPLLNQDQTPFSPSSIWSSNLIRIPHPKKWLLKWTLEILPQQKWLFPRKERRIESIYNELLSSSHHK